MVKAYMKLMWDVYYEAMIEIFNFKSPNAKAAAFRVSDHLKCCVLLRIATEMLVASEIINDCK